jgi:hypothetical protein
MESCAHSKDTSICLREDFVYKSMREMTQNGEIDSVTIEELPFCTIMKGEFGEVLCH